MNEIATFNELSEATCWQAVLENDRRFDGVFVLGVKTTGIYCRPSCPARTPKRENVSFFPNCQAAEQAGYRACRRCRPDERDFEVALVEKLCRHIESHFDPPPSLSELSLVSDVSPSHLHRVFKRVMGITPKQYADARRLEQFTTLLKDRQDVITAVYEAGYGSTSRAYEQAPAQIGMTPSQYQNGGSGVQIEYAIVDSPLGRLLVAATPRGICRVSLGEDDQALQTLLFEEYPRAQVARNENGLAGHVTAILRNLNGQQPHLDLPLDIQVTAFQRQVLEALRAIPYGQTRSYSEIAAAIGQPKSSRAVGHACATNPVPLVIPCHRVIRNDGGLGGYRFGLQRKSILLEMERAYSQNE